MRVPKGPQEDCGRAKGRERVEVVPSDCRAFRAWEATRECMRFPNITSRQ